MQISLKKCTNAEIILKHLIQKKKLSIHLSDYSLFTNCLFNSTKNKLIVTKVKIKWKGFLKT